MLSWISSVKILHFQGDRQARACGHSHSDLSGNLDELSDNDITVGYKILKIYGTNKQMSQVLDELTLLNVEYEEIEDGMPKDFEEITEPVMDSFVAFDIETSGTSGAAYDDLPSEITEIGAVKVVNGEVISTFSELCNPGRKITRRVEQLTHITNEMVKDKPSVNEVIKQYQTDHYDELLEIYAEQGEKEMNKKLYSDLIPIIIGDMQKRLEEASPAEEKTILSLEKIDGKWLVTDLVENRPQPEAVQEAGTGETAEEASHKESDNEESAAAGTTSGSHEYADEGITDTESEEDGGTSDEAEETTEGENED